MPHLDDLLDHISGAIAFTKLNFKSGYLKFEYSLGMNEKQPLKLVKVYIQVFNTAI